MDISTRSVITKLKNDYEDVVEFDQIVNAWNQLCEQAALSQDGELKFADVERAAISVLSEAPRKQSRCTVGPDVSRMINAFEYPAYLVTSGGLVAASNLAAWKEYDLDALESIDLLPFSLEDSVPISQLISDELRKDFDNDESKLIVKRSYAKQGEQDATIAISLSNGGRPSALIFVITTKWRPGSARILQRQFNLTKTEAALLVSFIDGYSTQDIAKNRKRSHDTIRTQFQTIRDKVGAKNQTELLRKTLSVSEFTKDISEITNVLEHPHRRKAEQLIAGGRLVEFSTMGDSNGDPFVMIAAGGQYTFNAEIEQKLFDANLLVICICPPGFGSTDTAPDGVKWIDQSVEDVVAVLGQLDVKKCGLLIKLTNAHIAYRAAKKYPSLFYHIVQVSTCGPAIYDKYSTDRSSWVSGVITASLKNSSIRHILMRGGIKAWVTIGAKQFMRLQMTGNPVDAKYALLSENIAEYEHALQTATTRGISGLLEEHMLVFGDWTDEIHAVTQDITAIHGIENKLFSIESVRSLASNFQDKMQVIAVENAGFTLMQSHPDRVIEILKSLVEYQKTSTGDCLQQLHSEDGLQQMVVRENSVNQVQ